MELVAFLMARIAEDEAVAEAASPGGWQYGDVASVAGGSLYDETRMISSLHYEQLSDHDGRIVRHLLSAEADANGAHIARWDPARVLAECAAKRRIVEMASTAQNRQMISEPVLLLTLRTLAQPYADHADYDPAWNPEATQ